MSTINTTAIANHLNAEIIEVREWATVLWVKAVKSGKIICRFVSKKLSVMPKSFSVEEFVSAVNDSNKLVRISRWQKEGHDRLYFKTSAKSKCWISAKSAFCIEDIAKAVSADYYKKEIVEICAETLGSATVVPVTPNLCDAKVLVGICWNCHVNVATHGGLCVDCVD